jgi:hypothetical protein
MKYGGRMWSEFIWFRIHNDGGLLLTRNEPWVPIKYAEFLDYFSNY